MNLLFLPQYSTIRVFDFQVIFQIPECYRVLEICEFDTDELMKGSRSKLKRGMGVVYGRQPRTFRQYEEDVMAMLSS